MGNRRILQEKDRFRFECHSGVACFTRCCKNPDMYLYPYDIIRMKNQLGMSSEQFLGAYTLSAFRDNPYFPSMMLKMADDEEKTCPFLSPRGCSIYEDRPFSCRAYPLERAVARSGWNDEREECYFVAVHEHCLGHEESREWKVGEWLDDQNIRIYNEMNDLWVEIDTMFRNNPWGQQGISNPALKMAFMACFNIDAFKRFVFESSFLERFDLASERLEQVKTSDAEAMKLGFDWVRLFLTQPDHVGSSAFRRSL